MRATRPSTRRQVASASRAKSEMPTRAAPGHHHPGQHQLVAASLPSHPSGRRRKKLAKVYQYRPGADLLRPGRLHIVGGPGWPARVLTDEQTRRRKHAPADGTPDGHRQEDDPWTNDRSTTSSRTFEPPVSAPRRSPGSWSASASARRSRRSCSVPRSSGPSREAMAFAPTRRGGGGQLKVLWWQAPTLLNPHFAVGTKDQDGSRVFYEPLAAFDPDGNLFPIARRRDPDASRTAAWREDGKSVTWKLKQRRRPGTTASPFTADDRRLQLGVRVPTRRPRPSRSRPYRDIERIDKIDSHTVRLVVQEPNALLVRRLLRRARHDHPQASLPGLQGRQVARGADQPETGRHRTLPVRRFQAGRSRPGRDQSRPTTCRTARSSTRSR